MTTSITPLSDPQLPEDVRVALTTGRLCDITTHGRQSGEDRRIEIAYFNFDGRFYISGLPGRRGWYANLLAQRAFTFHVKGAAQADLAATARPITDEVERRSVLQAIVRQWRREAQLEQFVADSPLVEVTFADRSLLER